MKLWVGVTDNRWFEFLAGRQLDEVNFWQPSAKSLLANAQYGMPFLFKLKRPNNAIAGGGILVAQSSFPVSIAWEIFGEKCGAASLPELLELVSRSAKGVKRESSIVCTVLANPVFLSRRLWLESPPDWSGPIVRGKYYDTVSDSGSAIWRHLGPHFSDELLPERRISEALISSNFSGADGLKYGSPITLRPRLGQSTFRLMVTDAYKRRCAMTGETTLDVLEAAHIVPYSESGGSHDVSNGLLLRSDFHKLFDRGLVSVDPSYRIRISPRIREAYFNGKAYYRLEGQSLAVIPDVAASRPDKDRLAWHFSNCFQG